MATGVDASGLHEERNTDVVEFAVRQPRSAMADRAVAGADEDREAALRSDGVRAIAALSPRARASRKSSNGVRPVTSVSWYAASALAASTARPRLRRGAPPNGLDVHGAQLRVRPDRRDVRRDASPISRGSTRGRRLCAHRLSFAPSQPYQRGRRRSRCRRVAVDALDAVRPRASVRQCARRRMARRARDGPPARQPHGSPKSRSPNAIAARLPDTRFDGSMTARRRPRSERGRCADFGVGERHRCRCGCLGAAGPYDKVATTSANPVAHGTDHALPRFAPRLPALGKQAHLTPPVSPRGVHSTRNVAASRCVVLPADDVERQVPAARHVEQQALARYTPGSGRRSRSAR